MKPNRRLPILAFFFFMLVPLHAFGQDETKAPDAAVVFKTRSALEKTLGPEISKQVPGYFDFSTHALVFVKNEIADGAQVKIYEPLGIHGLRFSQSSSLTIFFVVEDRIKVVLVPDNPCSGGMRRTPDVRRRCNQGVQTSIENAKKTVLLFAIPKKKMKSLTVVKRAMPKRP